MTKRKLAAAVGELPVEPAPMPAEAPAVRQVTETGPLAQTDEQYAAMFRQLAAANYTREEKAGMRLAIQKAKQMGMDEKEMWREMRASHPDPNQGVLARRADWQRMIDSEIARRSEASGSRRSMEKEDRTQLERGKKALEEAHRRAAAQKAKSPQASPGSPEEAAVTATPPAAVREKPTELSRLTPGSGRKYIEARRRQPPPAPVKQLMFSPQMKLRKEGPAAEREIDRSRAQGEHMQTRSSKVTDMNATD